MAVLPIKFLQECFDYNQNTGAIKWRIRPYNHFISSIVVQNWNKMFAGKEITLVDGKSKGIKVQVSYQGKKYWLSGHKIAWAIYHGSYPTGPIIHKNSNNTDNRINNLGLK